MTMTDTEISLLVSIAAVIFVALGIIYYLWKDNRELVEKLYIQRHESLRHFTKDDIVLRGRYYIRYHDTNYPCSCKCHWGQPVKHKGPCCVDRSYYGDAICVEKSEKYSYCIFRPLKIEHDYSLEHILVYPEKVSTCKDWENTAWEAPKKGEDNGNKT